MVESGSLGLDLLVMPFEERSKPYEAQMEQQSVSFKGYF